MHFADTHLIHVFLFSSGTGANAGYLAFGEGTRTSNPHTGIIRGPTGGVRLTGVLRHSSRNVAGDKDKGGNEDLGGIENDKWCKKTILGQLHTSHLHDDELY